MGPLLDLLLLLSFHGYKCAGRSRMPPSPLSPTSEGRRTHLLPYSPPRGKG